MGRRSPRSVDADRQPGRAGRSDPALPAPQTIDDITWRLSGLSEAGGVLEVSGNASGPSIGPDDSALQHVQPRTAWGARLTLLLRWLRRNNRPPRLRPHVRAACGGHRTAPDRASDLHDRCLLRPRRLAHLVSSPPSERGPDLPRRSARRLRCPPPPGPQSLTTTMPDDEMGMFMAHHVHQMESSPSSRNGPDSLSTLPTPVIARQILGVMANEVQGRVI